MQLYASVHSDFVFANTKHPGEGDLIQLILKC
jgi:hypothetical protein